VTGETHSAEKMCVGFLKNPCASFESLPANGLVAGTASDNIDVA